MCGSKCGRVDFLCRSNCWEGGRVSSYLYLLCYEATFRDVESVKWRSTVTSSPVTLTRFEAMPASNIPTKCLGVNEIARFKTNILPLLHEHRNPRVARNPRHTYQIEWSPEFLTRPIRITTAGSCWRISTIRPLSRPLSTSPPSFSANWGRCRLHARMQQPCRISTS